MTHKRGAAASDYRAPLFVAWQLTNLCRGRCLHCCEDSGPLKGTRQRGSWPGELSRRECLAVARDCAASGVSYAAFGGGEPMEVPHFWDVLETLSRGGVAVKIETTGEAVEAGAARRLAGLGVSSIQVSLDGPDARTHEALRPGCSFERALASVRALAREGLEPEVVFIPTRLNLASAAGVYDLAREAGARVFATGPLMRLGRAWAAWRELAPAACAWRRTVRALEARARQGGPRLSVYPWGIQQEIRSRLDAPQAMVLIAPDGRVKLLNALPFAPGDLRRHSLAEAWKRCVAAWQSPEVRRFCLRASRDPRLLAHANECWDA